MAKVLVGLFLLLVPFLAPAQPGPIFFVDHDWTFRVGGQTFGVREWRVLGDEKYGGGKHTTFYFCQRQCSLRTRIARVVEFALAVALLGLLALYVRGLKSGPHEPSSPLAGAGKESGP